MTVNRLTKFVHPQELSELYKLDDKVLDRLTGHEVSIIDSYC